MEGIHVGFGRRICTDASSKPLPIATRIVCGLFIALAQIRRSKLRCTCHGAIFERVLVRRTQEYKSIPRTTSRKSPEIAHVRRHGSLSCMPLFSPREPLFHYPFIILLFFALLLDDYPYRRTLKAVGVSEAVFDISLIREVEQLGAVAENYKRRRLYSRLGHIIQL